jgi:hypothetical protein
MIASLGVWQLVGTTQEHAKKLASEEHIKTI